MLERPPSPFFRLWLTETVRLREAHWGLVDDKDAVRQARLAGGDLAERVQTRALHIAERDALPRRLWAWRTGGVWTLVALIAVALVAGALTASGALGDPARPVNILWALGALLGLHALTFLIWLGSLLWGGAGHGLGAAWLWATRKLARGPQARLIPSAFVNLLAQAGARAAFFGSITHLFWLTALVSALVTLVVLLSTAQYQFLWATTLLDPQAFVALTRTLGALPGLLGFPSPDAATILASDGRSTLGAAAHAQWSLWLLGTLLVYGVIPRLIALTWCVINVRRSLNALALDIRLPGIDTLQDRLMPPAVADAPLEPDPAVHQPHIDDQRLPANTSGQRLVATLELPDAFPWPPAALTADASLTDVGPIDAREQRRRLQDALAAGPAERLLVVCDRHQTPDRGSIGLITELADHVNAIHVWLADTGRADDAADRTDLWRTHLNRAGLRDDAIAMSENAALQWLQERVA